MEVKEMNLEQIETRKAEINKLLDSPEADLEALSAEVDELEARATEIRKEIETRNGLKTKVLTEGTVIERKEEKMSNYTVASPEYRSAYFKNFAGEDMSVEERAAFTHVTTNFGGALPAQVLSEIVSLIEEQHPILGDITSYRTGVVLEINKHTAIAAGDAKSVAEGVANDDEENTFAKVTLSGKDFSKTVEVSYALGKMNGNALESYLTKEIADRLGAALARDVIAQIGTDVLAANKIETATALELSFADVAGAFAAIKNAASKVVYVSNATLYNRLATLENTAGQLIFQPTANAGLSGYLLGSPVKVEDGIADDVILIGDPKAVAGNYVQDILIESDRDIKRHVDIYSGYARFQCSLVKPKAFAQLTVKAV